jgi:hypothetical protein
VGVSLSYTTTAAVTAKVRAAIFADTARVNGERRWWCEGITFFKDPKRSKHLTGDTKLFYPGCYSDPEEEAGLTEVDADDDTFMGFRDAAFIVRLLMCWSNDHGVNWVLEMAGGEVGTVVSGQVQPAGLFECDKPENKANLRRAARIDKKYATRNT